MYSGTKRHDCNNEVTDQLGRGNKSVLYAPVPALWSCSFVHVNDWVNNHAEKPYVQRVGCPTFGDDDERRNMSGLLGGHI